MASPTSTLNVLRVDASMRKTGSTTRRLADKMIDVLGSQGASLVVKNRDLADGVTLITEDWIGANFTPVDQRSDAQRAALAQSDQFVAEVKAADVLVLAVPIYNFAPPAAFKAWIDQIARAQVTFRYTENGPVGLLEGKKAYVLLASGGTPMGSEMDFASGYIRHILGFIGIKDITFVAADKLMSDTERVVSAERKIEETIQQPKAA